MADKRKLARRLALWSIADQIDHESVDKEVALFSKESAKDVEELAETQKQIEELTVKQQEIVNRMLSECSKNVQRLQGETKNSIARPLVDLAFWNRMSDLNEDLYKVIHPYLTEIGDEEA